MPRAIALIGVALATLPAVALAGPEAGLSGDCAILIAAVNHSLPRVELEGCAEDSAAQTRAEARFGIPAIDVEDWIARLQTHGMGEMRWVCCGYEAHPAASLPIPTGSPIAATEQPGARPALIARIDLPGLGDDPEFPPIGVSDGTLVVSWMEV